MFRVAILLVLVTVASTFAQPAPQTTPPASEAVQQRTGRPGPSSPQARKWWQTETTRAELGLTQDQSARIEDIWQQSVPRLTSSSDDLERSQRELSRLISSNDATEMDVIRQLVRVQAVRNEADRQRTLTLFRMYRVLTYDQRMKLKALRERWEQERRSRRGEPPQQARGQIRK